jgi:hypothetical protein
VSGLWWFDSKTKVNRTSSQDRRPRTDAASYPRYLLQHSPNIRIVSYSRLDVVMGVEMAERSRDVHAAGLCVT